MDGCFICRIKAAYPTKGGRNESGIDFLIQDSARKSRRIFHKMSTCSPKKWHCSHSKKWLKHIPPCTCLITVQIMPVTIWTQSNLISCNFLPFQLCTHSTLTSQPLLMPNWIFAANGLLPLLAPPPPHHHILTCPGVPLLTNTDYDLFFKGGRRQWFLKLMLGSVRTAIKPHIVWRLKQKKAF